MLHIALLIVLQLLCNYGLEKKQQCNRKSENSFLHIVIHKQKTTIMSTKIFISFHWEKKMDSNASIYDMW